MAPEQHRILSLRLNWSNFIAIIGIGITIMITQNQNHKETIQKMIDFKDSVLVDHRDFINHQNSDNYIHQMMLANLKDHEDRIFTLSNKLH